MGRKVYYGMISLFVFIYSQLMAGESTFHLAAGVGVLDFAHVGIQYAGERYGVGLYSGYWPFNSAEESTWSAGIDGYYFYHDGTFKGRQSPWYVRIGGQYLADTTPTVSDRYWGATLRLGKRFRMNDHLSVWVDAGAFIKINRTRNIRGDITTIQPGLNISIPVFPVASLGVVYRF